MHSMHMTSPAVACLLQDRFADNKEQLQDVLNEIVTLKQLQ